MYHRPQCEKNTIIIAQDVYGVKASQEKEAGNSCLPYNCHGGSLVRTHPPPTAVLNLTKRRG